LGKTVGEIETSMTMRELRDWQRFEWLNRRPLPDRLGDVHFAMVLSAMVNLMRSSDSPPAMPADFFVLRDPEPEPARSPISEIDRLRTAWRGEADPWQ
jgi:hypothetical protein